MINCFMFCSQYIPGYVRTWSIKKIAATAKNLQVRIKLYTQNSCSNIALIRLTNCRIEATLRIITSTLGNSVKSENHHERTTQCIPMSDETNKFSYWGQPHLIITYKQTYLKWFIFEEILDLAHCLATFLIYRFWSFSWMHRRRIKNPLIRDLVGLFFA